MEEDEKFQSFLDMFQRMQNQSRTQIINPMRIKEMESAYKALSKIVLDADPDAKIYCRIHETNAGNGVIRIETDEFVVDNVKEFSDSIKNASNFEIYPLKNGKIKIAVMFYEIMKEI